METIRRVAFCPHCGNRAPQRLVYSHEYYGASYSSDGKLDEHGPPCEYFIAICETCDEILVYHSHCNAEEKYNFHEADLFYPKSVKLHLSVPDLVKNCYLEAAKIQNTAPNAYVVMIRRALESLCDDRGVKKKPLQKRLQELSSRGEIPPTLAEITDVLRVLGNAGAHATSQPITVPLTWGVDDFFRAVIEYVYVAPSKLKDFKEKLDKYQSNKKPNQPLKPT